DSGFGYRRNDMYLRWLQRTEPADRAWERLDEPRPPGMFFWYRQSPSAFRPGAGGDAWPERAPLFATTPPWSQAGEAYVSLDLAGRLRRFYVLPRDAVLESDEGGSASAEDPDWGALFDAAGLDLEQFTPEEPRYQWNFRADVRRAWAGHYPERPEIPLRIEAGASGGRTMYFRTQAPWHEPGGADTAAPSGGRRWPAVLGMLSTTVQRGSWVLSLAAVVLLSVGALMAALGRGRSRHGDRRGANRLAVFIFVVVLVQATLSGHHPLLQDLGGGRTPVLATLSAAGFLGLCAWVCYMVVEPYLRRSWPTMLVAWTRVLSGRWRDPLVGRSVLAGLLVGALGVLLRIVDLRAAGWLGTPGILPPWGGFNYARSVRMTIVEMCGGVAVPMLMAFAFLLVLVLLRVAVKHLTLAAVLFVLIMPFVDVNSRITGPMPWSLLTTVTWSILILGLYLRLGLLAVMVALCCDRVVAYVPLTTDLSRWYAYATLLPMGLLLLVGVWGLTAAVTGPRPERRRAEVITATARS
ncbi:MAG: hypothetical protein ACYTGC_14545, partial [Planctomycetota bacterium]